LYGGEALTPGDSNCAPCNSLCLVSMGGGLNVCRTGKTGLRASSSSDASGVCCCGAAAEAFL